MNEVQEKPNEKIILWQDHSHPNGYRPSLVLIKFEDGTKYLELNVHGSVWRTPYTFPFSEKDRL